MISNKTLATIFIITLNMQRAAASSSSSTQKPSPSGESAPLVRKRRPILKPNEMLADASSTVNDVEVHRESTEETSTSRELSVSQVNNPFKALIENGEYEKIFELGKEMRDEEFLEQLCPVIETFEQYKGVAKYLKDRNWLASFYVYGNIEVVKRAITELRVYDVDNHYVDGGDLEAALPLALGRDRHDRVIELFDFRKGITAEEDGQCKLEGGRAGFEDFVYYFLNILAPWEDGMALKRFLILRGDELRTKYPDILDTLCQELVGRLRDELDLPEAESLFLDLIGQPSLLTPVVFAKGFLDCGNDEIRSAFIKHGYREAIQEGLKPEYWCGGEALWLAMRREKPNQYPGQFPDTEKARSAACAHLPTKQQKEDEWVKKYEKWIKENALILYNKLKPHDDIFNLLPGVLWLIIFEYALYIG